MKNLESQSLLVSKKKISNLRAKTFNKKGVPAVFKSVLLVFYIIFGLVGGGMFVSSSLAAEDLTSLLKQVKSDQKLQKAENIAREKEFAAKKKQQKSLLLQSKKELKQLEAITAQLMNEFGKNEKKLAKKEEDLNLAKGTLGELFGVVRQVAGDLRGQVQNSVISAQIPGRQAFISQMAESKSLPNISNLENLWFHLQQEMTEAGKITAFQGSVVTPSGEKQNKEIVRVGSFNLVSDGKYLSFEGDTQQVVELPRQPAGKYLSTAADLQEADEKLTDFALDPSRGAILGMLIQTPSLGERINQGGLVGYVILVLLAIGLAIVGERLFVLKKEGEKLDAQLKSEKANENNPLGQLISVFEKNKDKDLETIEVKMDEVIIKSLPIYKRGINTVKILSAVAPLLGLLGTVTGMILTFQSITLFGTGDPKLMAGGISQALITTVLGLVCAIPLLLLHNFVAAKSKRLVQILEEQSAGLIASRMEQGKA